MSAIELRKELENHLRRHAEVFYHLPEENRFAALVEGGQGAFKELSEALSSADAAVRIDALLAFGQLFTSHGHTDAALDAVVAHAKALSDPRISPERQAALFAIGRSREPSLMENFMSVLGASSAQAVCAAAFCLGYGRYRPAEKNLIWVVEQKNSDTIGAAAWALGQLESQLAAEVFVDMLVRDMFPEQLIGPLGDIGAPIALPELSRILGHKTPGVRYAALLSIKAIVAKMPRRAVHQALLAMVPALQELATDKFPPTAVQALLFLAELDQPLNEEVVRAALRMPEAQFAISEVAHFTLTGRAPPTP